jgi:hypothetical protein
MSRPEEWLAAARAAAAAAPAATDEALRRATLECLALRLAVGRGLCGRAAETAWTRFLTEPSAAESLAAAWQAWAARLGDAAGQLLGEAPALAALPAPSRQPLAAAAEALEGGAPVRLLGDVYEILRSADLRIAAAGRGPARHSARHQQGLFLTPPAMIRRVLSRVLPRPRRGAGAPVICDPAMGTGHFLIAAARRLAGEDRAAARHLAATRLYGVDLDPEAVRLARLSFWLEFSTPLAPFELPEHLRCGDALLGPLWDGAPPAARGAEFDWAAAFPAVAAGGGFAVVLGNPPYDVLTNFRRHPERGQYARRLRRSGAYRLAAEGQLNLYRLFIERGLQLLRPGGRLSFVVPAGLLTDRVAAPLRVALLEEHGLERVDHFAESEKSFPGVTQAVCILAARKGAGSAGRVRLRHAVAGERREQRLSRGMLTTLDEESLPLPLASPEEWRLVRWLDAHATARFGDLAEGAVGEVDQTLYADCLRDDRGALLLRGCHVGPYAADLEPAPARQRFLDEEAFLARKSAPPAPGAAAPWGGPRLAQLGIRNLESRPRLVAARVPAGTYLGNSVNWWRPRERVPATLLAALLNSALLDWRFRLTSSNNNVNVYEVAGLPVPEAWLRYVRRDERLSPRRRSRLAARLRALEEAVVRAEKAAARGRGLPAARRRVDALVCELYGLPERFRAWLIPPG